MTGEVKEYFKRYKMRRIIEDDEIPELTSEDFKKAVRNPYAQYFREKEALQEESKDNEQVKYEGGIYD